VSWPRQGLTHAVRDDTFLSIVGLRGKCWPEYCNAGNALMNPLGGTRWYEQILFFRVIGPFKYLAASKYREAVVVL
jgi:hypothetical protein